MFRETAVFRSVALRPRADIRARQRLESISTALGRVGTRFPALDALIERRTIGEIDENEFADGVDRIIGDAEVTRADIDQIRSSSPRLSAHVIAQQLRLSKRTLAALEERCARLRDTEQMLLFELEADKLEQRVLPAYLFEFALRLQAAGVSQQEIRGLSSRKLEKDLDALSDLVSAKGNSAADSVATSSIASSSRNIVTSDEIGAEPSDELHVGLRNYEAVIRPVTSTSDLEAHSMRLPTVDSLVDYESDDHLLTMMVEQAYRYKDTNLFIDVALPSYMSHVGITLNERERSAWTFLLFVRHMENVSEGVADALQLDGMVLPLPGKTNLVWQVQRVDHIAGG